MRPPPQVLDVFGVRDPEPLAGGEGTSWRCGDLVVEPFQTRSVEELDWQRRLPVTGRSQLVHGDLTGNVLFADDLPPAVIDFSPYWRPPASSVRSGSPAGSRDRVVDVEQRVSLITLGVRDLGRARAFYEALGWESGAAPADEVVFFQTGGMVVALLGRDQLAEDSGVEDSGGWGGITLAHNVRSPAEVDAVLAEAEAAGATIPRPGAATFWGGYSGMFVDPDDHAWEIAHNPGWKIREDGSVTLPADT